MIESILDQRMMKLSAGHGEQIITDQVSLHSISSEWDDLVSDSSASVFQMFDWQSLWWKSFASTDRNTLFVIVFRDSDKIIGIAPFFIQFRTVLEVVVYRQLKLLGSGLKAERTSIISLETEGPGDYLDVIARYGYEDTVGNMVAKFLSSNNFRWDEIEFQNIPEAGVLMKYVLPRLRTSHLEIKSAMTEVCPMVILNGSWENTLKSLSARARRSFRRAESNYIENGEFTIEDAELSGNIDEALNELSRLHQKHWNSIGYPGLFSDPRFNLLYRELAKVFHQKGRLWLTLLRHNQEAIAARLCFVLKDRVYDYLSGFDIGGGNDEGASYSGAGTALLVTTMKRAGVSGYRFFDLLRGDEGYKFDLTSFAPVNYQIVIRQTRGAWRLRACIFKLIGGWFQLRTRMICEWEILRVIVEENGIIAAGRIYPSHLKKRLKKKRSVNTLKEAGDNY